MTPSEGCVLFGSAARDITPAGPVPLAGFAHRQGFSAGVHSRLWVRAFALADLHTGRRVAVAVADLLGWEDGLASRIESRCAERFGSEGVLLSATHTHSGPCVLPLTGILQTKPDAEYLEFLAGQTVAAIGEAFKHLSKVQIRRCSAFAPGLAIHRRVMTDRGIEARPNETGPRDDEVIVWKFQRSDGQVLGAWLHFACHPTILSGAEISAEYMGGVVQAIEAAHPGLACAFLQGCAGDVRPNLTDGEGHFRRGGPDDLDRFSEVMTQAAQQALETKGEVVDEYDLRIDRRQFQAVARPANSEQKGQPVPISISLKGLKLARNVGLIALPGEPSVAYQKAIKAESGGQILPLGYANGFPGYLPTAAQIREGGYESVLSCPLFGLPGPFDESLEARLLAGAKELAVMIGQ